MDHSIQKPFFLVNNSFPPIPYNFFGYKSIRLKNFNQRVNFSLSHYMPYMPEN